MAQRSPSSCCSQEANVNTEIKYENWVVVQSMGGGAAREMSTNIDVQVKKHLLVLLRALPSLNRFHKS